jgi:serine/threonine protein kinase
MSTDGNLWCEQTDCPAGNIPIVLDYGEFLGDIKVTRLLRLFRTAAVYEAERDEQLILLKVAHAGHEDDLKAESALLARLARANQPNLPVLLPAYRQGNLKDHSYGKAVFRNETKYYEVFQHITGEFLRDTLIKNPQPWYQHTAWIMIGIAQGLSYLYKHEGGLHLNICPDVIMIHEDANKTPIPVLLDLGLILKPQTATPEVQKRARHNIMPAYLPPELLERGATIGEAGDVYGLGILFHEMLSGAPAYPYRLRADDEVRAQVKREGVPRAERRDIPQANTVQALIESATNRNPANRPQSVVEFGKSITSIFGSVPPPKRTFLKRFSDWSVPVIVGCVIFVLVALLLGALVQV